MFIYFAGIFLSSIGKIITESWRMLTFVKNMWLYILILFGLPGN